MLCFNNKRLRDRDFKAYAFKMHANLRKNMDMQITLNQGKVLLMAMIISDIYLHNASDFLYT